MKDLLLTFYGDDFTGSTDAMEALTFNGIPTALFLEPPLPEHLQGRFANLRAIGVAGVSRSMTSVEMERELWPRLTALKALGAPVTHYKICSTFDSSPTIGSIGKAIDIGYEVFDCPIVPLLVGAPSLKRYVAFGNLFATVGDTTWRLDRHPTMSRHPVTPMDEGDLRIHLGKQTPRRLDLIDLRHLAAEDKLIEARLREMIAAGTEIVLFDTLDDDHLLKIGKLIWQMAQDRPVFTVGSSGVEYALTGWWRKAGIIDKPQVSQQATRARQIVVMSGSASPISAQQIDHAIAQGFCDIRLDSARLVNPNVADQAREAVIMQALAALERGQSVMLYSVHGPDDPIIATTKTHLQSLGLDPNDVGKRLATQQGLILRELFWRMPQLKRACIAGGDTCGHTMRQMDVFALETIAPLVPGGPLCRMSSHESRLDGLEIVLKGGQVGGADFYELILNRGSNSVG